MLNVTQKLKIGCVLKACMFYLFSLQFQKSQMTKDQRCLKTSELLGKKLRLSRGFISFMRLDGIERIFLKQGFSIS